MWRAGHSDRTAGLAPPPSLVARASFEVLRFPCAPARRRAGRRSLRPARGGHTLGAGGPARGSRGALRRVWCRWGTPAVDSILCLVDSTWSTSGSGLVRARPSSSEVVGEPGPVPVVALHSGDEPACGLEPPPYWQPSCDAGGLDAVDAIGEAHVCSRYVHLRGQPRSTLRVCCMAS